MCSRLDAREPPEGSRQAGKQDEAGDTSKNEADTHLVFPPGREEDSYTQEEYDDGDALPLRVGLPQLIVPLYWHIPVYLYMYTYLYITTTKPMMSVAYVDL